MTGRLPALGLVAACLLACSGPERGTRAGARVPVPDPVMAEVAVQCLDLLEEYREIDLETASEEELERQMDEALLNEELCRQALTEAYDGPGGNVMARHLARQVGLHALKAELTLSDRFDEMGGYCVILEELIGHLGDDLAAVGEVLAGDADGRSPLPDEDLAALVSLRDLSLQTLQVSLADYQASCQ